MFHQVGHIIHSNDSIVGLIHCFDISIRPIYKYHCLKFSKESLKRNSFDKHKEKYENHNLISDNQQSKVNNMIYINVNNTMKFFKTKHKK